MASKIELIEELESLGVIVDPTTHPSTLLKMLREAKNTTPSNDEDEVMNPPADVQINKPNTVKRDDKEYMEVTDVRRLIAEMLEKQTQEAKTPKKLSKVKEHFANVHRFNAKWVVDFVNKNTDHYIKGTIHAYNKYDPERRETRAWIDLVFEDESVFSVLLSTYLSARVTVQCLIKERRQIDTSYVTGEVEQKKIVDDKNVGTGIMIQQEVTQYREQFVVVTPEKTELTLPDYVLA